MEHVQIEINTLDDTNRGKKLFPDLEGKPIAMGRVSHFGILEGGMVSGKTSCMVAITLEDGSVAIGQVTGNLFDGMAKALEELGPNLLNKVPADAEKFYPGFSRLDHEGRKAFWLMFISSLIQYESNYDPATTYQESFKDNAGANVISRGLLQISVESGNGSYYRCGVTTTSLHDPVTNLRCGVKIMNYWMGRDGVITSKSGDTWLGIARYWGPMRKDEKVSAIALKTRAI